MQVVCDHRLKIRHAIIGHHGSVHDAKMFAESSIGQHPEQFFSDKQFMAGDSAYPLSRFVITPIRQNNTEFSEHQKAKFNEHFSKARVRVENCFGKLKEIFCSLKELRFRLTNEQNHTDCCNWILACCILHNILIEFNNPQNDDDSRNEVDYPQEMSSSRDVRTALVNYVLNNL